MIPRTFPSTYASNGQQQMVVYFLPSIADLRRWLDYIPVKLSQGGVENSYANNGYIDVTVVSRPTATQQAWKEYIPVYLDDAATDAWQVNARGYIPYGYALFGGASMIMDMTNTGALDSRVTFSRTSNATQFDSAGNLVYAPHNLLTFSESFDSSVWSKTAGTVTANVGVAPDGTTTADQIASTGAGVFRSGITVTQGVLHTASVYAKAVSGGGVFSFGFDANPANGRASFDLSTGIVSSLGTNVVAATAEALPNGWYRCVVSAITTSTTCILVYYNATSGATFFVWGAQLNVGTLQPYYPTTVKNLLGFAQEFDNAAWTKSNSFVQTNQIRNNTMQGAVAGTPGTLPTNWATVALGVSRQIVGSGIENGVSYIDIRFFGTPSSSADIQVLFEPNNGIAAANLTTYTESVFVALVGGSLTNISAVRLAVGTYSAAAAFLQYLTGANIGGSITSTMQRFSTSVTTSNASTAFAQPAVGLSATSGQAIDITLRVGWPQLVQGAVAGDPVATYGTARAVMYPAPDGSVTGDKLVETTAASATHLTQQTFTSVSGAIYTASVYVKAGERGEFALQLVGGFTGTQVRVNLLTGAVINTSGSPISSGAVSVGNGWYRVYLSQIATSTASSTYVSYISVGGTTVYTGDGTSGIFIWGAQLSDSASLDPYVYNPVAAPTAAAYYGPRFDYDPATLAARGLLIEEQRTNSIRNNSMVGAVAGTPGTLPTNWTVGGQGLTTNVIGTGTSAGITYVDLQITGTPTGSPYVLSFESSAISAAASQTWTESAWFALVGGNLTNVGTINLRMRVYDSGSVFLGQSDSAALTLTSSLVRNSHNYPSLPALTAFIEPALRVGLTAGQAVNFTIRIGLPQLELGAFATSVIPTTTAAATRTADVATMVGANFGNWYNQSEGTLFTEHTSLSVLTGGQSIALGKYPRLWQIDAGAIESVAYWYGSQAELYIGNTYNFLGTVPATVNKLSVAFSSVAGQSASSLNGAAASARSGVLSGQATVIGIGNDGASTSNSFLNGYIRRIAYYPTRLSNAQLQAVTA